MSQQNAAKVHTTIIEAWDQTENVSRFILQVST